MEINSHDRTILLDLADRLNLIFNSEENRNRIQLWKNCNGLRDCRPAVFVDCQNGWEEFHRAFTYPFMRCEGNDARSIEVGMRAKLARYEYIHDDYPVNNYITIGVSINKTSWGVDEILTRPDKTGQLTAYHIEPAIKNREDMKKLIPSQFSFDESSVERALEAKKLYEDLFENRLPVFLRGLTNWRCGLTRKLICLIGFENMLYDIYDDPDFLHEMMSFLRDEQMKELDFWERNKLVSPSNMPDIISGTGAPVLNDEMVSSTEFTREYTLKDMIGWGESQETVSVGPEQFREFVYEYQVPILRRFGRVDFGCCEPLDDKYDVIFSKLDNIRGVAVPPWADFELAAERLGNKYIYVFKQNPAYVCCEKPDFNVVDNDLRKVIRIAKKHDCPMHIVLKDTNSFYGQVQRVTEWSDTAVKIAREEYGRDW